MADNVYQPVTLSQVQEALQDYHDDHIYNPETDDCDDFTFRLLGYLKGTIRGALGFVWSKLHSFVIFYDSYTLWVIEPIGAAVFTYKEAKLDYFERYVRIKLVVI
jgi:hypothetical protein